MITALLVYACLAASPDRCRIFEVVVEPIECTMPVPAMMRAALWAHEHPDWSLRRWTCESGRPA